MGRFGRFGRFEISRETRDGGKIRPDDAAERKKLDEDLLRETEQVGFDDEELDTNTSEGILEEQQAFEIVVDDNVMWRQTGNSIAVPVIRAVIEQIIETLGL